MTTYQFNANIATIVADSRKAMPGALFLAYPGEQVDGRDYIANAVDKGATAVWWEPEAYTWDDNCQVEHQSVSDLKQKAGVIASQFYGYPSHALWVVGVTGTNGKTSVTQWLGQCFDWLDKKSAVIGTLGNGLQHQLTPTDNTTPDALLLQQLLASYVTEQAETVAMEVSSHGLSQGRVNGVKFDVAVLTNLSRDHLDYHGSYENYAAAKKRLFHFDGLQRVVLNIDDAFGVEIYQGLAADVQVLTYGIKAGDVRASSIRFATNSVMHFDVVTPYGKAALTINLIGRFNVYNTLAVLATLLISDIAFDDAIEVVQQIQSLDGRMQKFGGGSLPLVVVDFAHTPDSLQHVLQALRAETKGKLICVFGCGGNRDQGKRAMMGETVSALADVMVVTSDNPRNEPPDTIVQDILASVDSKYIAEVDRAQAIVVAIGKAQAGDVVLVAGKGHETYQEVAGVKYPFSDVEQVQAALKHYAEARMMLLSEVALAVNGKHIGDDVHVNSVGTDSRHIEIGQLFVAIKGEHFDGNSYAAGAIVQGAVAAIISDSKVIASPSVLVEDTRLALGQLAHYWRQKMSATVIGVTGSNGKTTVKEMIASILSVEKEAVLATKGNLNNDIGMPMTLLNIRREHQYAVVEMGMNHLGEIRYLTKIARPEVAVICNAGTAHIGELGSREAIAEAKGEIYEGLSDKGVAVINADDRFADYWRSLNADKKILTFGLKTEADITAEYKTQDDHTHITLITSSGNVGFKLHVLGEHNVSNALAASAVAIALGVDNQAIATGLERFVGVGGRLQIHVGYQSATVIDDTYNANPDSMKAAIEVLMNQQRNAKNHLIFVMGDMAELGDDAAAMHEEVGEYASQKGVTKLLAFGELSQLASKACGEKGQHFASLDALVNAIKAEMHDEACVLVKGSRSMKMERVVNAITKNEQ